MSSMSLISRPYPCVGMIISSPNTRTWLRSFQMFRQFTSWVRLAPKARTSMVSDMTGKVVAVPCEANFLSLKKLGTSEISSLRYLVRAACKAARIEGLLLNSLSTVQHVRRSLASDKSTVANDRSKDAFITMSEDLLWSLKSIKEPLKDSLH